MQTNRGRNTHKMDQIVIKNKDWRAENNARQLAFWAKMKKACDANGGQASNNGIAVVDLTKYKVVKL